MKQHFIIKIESIPEGGLQLKENWDAQTVNENLQKVDEVFTVCSPLSVNLTFTLLGKKVIIKGNVQVPLEITCVSCLAVFMYQLEVDFRYILWPQSETKVDDSETELTEQDVETGYYSADSIDLRPIIREQIYLAMPQNPHCRKNCLGLCPKCGVNLNEMKCKCPLTDSIVESPFQVLKKLKKS